LKRIDEGMGTILEQWGNTSEYKAASLEGVACGL
jgi:hypothetical protein